jgi:glutaminyl-tRNA synthetase
VPAEIRIYNPLFLRPDPGAGGDFAADINPQSLELVNEARLEPALADAVAGEAVQFERQGYFCRDAGEGLVFNRTIGLRDSWAKAQAADKSA